MSRDVPDGTDWSEVMKGGNNGLFIVVISLGWWAKALQFAARDMGDWDKAIGDVGWVIDHIKCCQLQRKHDRDEEDSTGDGPETKRFVFDHSHNVQTSADLDRCSGLRL